MTKQHSNTRNHKGLPGILQSAAIATRLLQCLVANMLINPYYYYALQRIPPAFIKYFNPKLPKTILLKVSTRIGWNVQLKKIGRNVFLLGKALRCFVEDNSIEFGYILQFRLCGDSKFYVTIYDRSCCEKEKSGEDVAWVKYQKSKSAKGKGVEGTLHVSGDLAARKNQNDIPIEKEKELEHQVTMKCLKRRERGAMFEFFDFKSDYPSFVCTLRGSSLSRGFMDLPAKFASKNLPETSKVVKVVDPEGRTWTVNYNRKNGRAHLGRGWNKVLLCNDFKENLTCAFELIDSKDVKLKISVLAKSLE